MSFIENYEKYINHDRGSDQQLIAQCKMVFQYADPLKLQMYNIFYIEKDGIQNVNFINQYYV